MQKKYSIDKAAAIQRYAYEKKLRLSEHTCDKAACIFFERHAELNSKNRPLGTVFTCSKIKRSLLNLFVVAALCFEKSAVSE